MRILSFCSVKPNCRMLTLCSLQIMRWRVESLRRCVNCQMQIAKQQLRTKICTYCNKLLSPIRTFACKTLLQSIKSIQVLFAFEAAIEGYN